MPNGRFGDHPLTDVLNGHQVYSERIDGLVREIWSLADQREREELANLLGGRFDRFARPDRAEMERVLTEIRDRVLRKGDAPPP